MAENKKSFILYCDQKGIWDKLDNEQAGKLIKHILAYVNDENPVCDDFVTELAFEPIKQQLKRDLKKWESTTDIRSKAGKAGAEARWQKIAKDSKRINGMAKMAVNDNVNDNVNVNVNESNTHTRTLGVGENFILVIPQTANSTKYRIQGAGGLAEYFDQYGSIPNYPQLSEAYLKARNGKVLNEFNHVWNDYNKFCQQQINAPQKQRQKLL